MQRRRSILLTFAMGMTVAACDSPPLTPAEKPDPKWVISPRSPGVNLPPQGRSLFDLLLAREGTVPFPFPALMRAVERHSPNPKAVLIPFSRSLQRAAAAPDFFSSPRIVAAADGETAAPGLLLKDRLFLGYNERAGMIEVISYNENAGRFEFQVVKDYREGAKPQVFYANRAVCMSCHQNAGPIFSRPLWDETHSNPNIAARLAATGKEFHGVPAERGIDTPNEIDDATDRANLFSLYQLLWREGCEDEACRGALLLDLLRYRLSGQLETEKWSRKWSARWPHGLAIPNPDIPNRDPFLHAGGHEIPANMEALEARAPLEIWSSREGAERTIAGFSEFIGAADIERLDQWLLGRPSSAVVYESDCHFSRGGDAILDVECKGGFDLRGRLYFDGDEVKKGRIDRLVFPREDRAELRDLEIESGGEEILRRGDQSLRESDQSLRLWRGRLSARLPQGNAIEHLFLAWRNDSASRWQGEAKLSVREDFQSLRTRIDELVKEKDDAFSAQPFRLAAMMQAIVPALEKRNAPRELEPPTLDTVAAGPITDSALQPFVRWCANCHRSNDSFPPNFMTGNAEQVKAKIGECAERIYVRLAMHDLPEGKRTKAPMPPPFASDGLEAEELAALREYAGDLVEARRSKPLALDELPLWPYENLRACLAKAE